jgi:hypothetical protein
MPALALALLAGAAGSCAGTGDVDMTPSARLTVDAHVGKTFSGDSTRVADITDDFAPNEAVLAVVDVPGRKDGVVRARWVYGSEVVSEQSIPIMEHVNAYRFRLEPPPGGHRAGQYKLEVYINDTLAETESFNVRAA